jgi:outer membrane protein
MITAVVFAVLATAGSAAAQATPPPPPPTPPPAQNPPAAQVPAPPKPATPAPFPEGAKMAFIDLQRVVDESALGKAGKDEIKKLSDKLGADLANKNKEIKALQDKMQSQKSVASIDVMNGWAKDLDRLQREAQFMQQDANVQMEQLQSDLLNRFQVKVLPIIEEVRKARGLWMVFALGENSPIAAADPGLDLTLEIVKRLDSVK